MDLVMMTFLQNFFLRKLIVFVDKDSPWSQDKNIHR